MLFTDSLLISTLALLAQAAPPRWGGGPPQWGSWPSQGNHGDHGGSGDQGNHGGRGGAPNGPPDHTLRSLPITRTGGELQLAGRKWSASGPNVYWLGLDENVIPAAGQPFYAPYNASYPTLGRITEIMNTVRVMGGALIRSQTLGISVGNPLSLWPTLATRNPQAFDTIDWAVYQARQHGLRLQLPLVDNYDYYHGGKFVFLRWFGMNIDTSKGYSSFSPQVQQFYTNATIISAFQDYISYLLTHKNPYTNLTYAEDPTIAIIETGNELSGPIFRDEDVPNSWTSQIAAFVRSLPGAQNKLIMDGTYGINTTHFALPIIDIYSDHFYPRNITQLNAGIAAVKSTNRVYMAGEYDWISNSGDTLPAFFDAIETHYAQSNPTISGDQFWSLFMHNVPNCNQYVNHTDGFTMQYGNPANLANVTERIEMVRQHFWKMQGVDVGLEEPVVACPGPDYEAGTPY